MMIEIMQLSADEIDAVLSVQERCYTVDLLEKRECFLHKVEIFRRGCLGALLEGGLVGYGFFHPWISNWPIPLNDTTFLIPAEANCIYIHDVAVVPDRRASKCGAKLIEQVVETGQELGLYTYALVAVQNSESYWKRWGFEENKKMTYGKSAATHMACCGVPRWR